MNWNELLSTKRLGLEDRGGEAVLKDRSQFQRDYDRIIFSSPFRRMQNKTQVFPLPGRVFVHNRLTHSLEVASVGRSLGSLLSDKLAEDKNTPYTTLQTEIGFVVSAACLAHDLGNPPFGHSGEVAISNFFIKGNGREFEGILTPGEWTDFTRFDGNANAVRTLANQFNGKRQGGFALTYTTLASIIKYPFESISATGQKFGFFQSEKDIYLRVANELNIPKTAENPGRYARHPLVYLVEAADDICYQIMDVEDAFKLGILAYDEARALFLGFYDEKDDEEKLKEISHTLKVVTDLNEQISYLRAGVIGKLMAQCADIFWQNREAIMEGLYEGSLIRNLNTTQAVAMDAVKNISYSKIYNHRTVVEIEIAGYKIIDTLLDEFTGAVMNPKGTYSKKLISLLPQQYCPKDDSVYHRIQSVVDFVSGMTDIFALDLYRKIRGISLPEIG
ncbi:Deoxyguanosinetriphosphate triphosphohydrolase [hydrothermal vent metagenome]|uniref:Deoxyguanosinetriphosphate triphosphohydrolase n=1 Tax=hydrothermal vent metagenome TaxID=652676 RepID=A0A3B0T9U2_9ZZZZ